ncbi:MAG: MBL fold metallo-hydrolase [Armatimonadota bacterium]
MNITFLGTGTSHGIPVIGCCCNVCTSSNPKNNRNRCSLLIENGYKNIIIDTPPEFRIQAVRFNINKADAILLTHSHADHIFGLDDVRRFNEIQNGSITVYGSEETLHTVKRVFEYVFVPTQIGGGKPKLNLKVIDKNFECCGENIIPIPVKHGKVDVLGYRIKDFAYVTDCNYIPGKSMDLLKDLDTIVLGVVRRKKHTTHFSVMEALDVIKDLKPKRAYFTHLSHKLEHCELDLELPQHISPAYDGLRLGFD